MDLTIIVPTRDRNAGVTECIHALEHNEAEIIVVDDASEEPVIVPPTARVVRHERQRGRSASINAGLKLASHDAVLIIDDDIYAAPDMVFRLIGEFSTLKNPMAAFKARVMWDPDVALTPTMKWMEDVHKFRAPFLLSKSFVLQHGGYDENFTRRLEDVELELRLKEHGLEIRHVESAVGFKHNAIRIRDLAEQEFIKGVSAVFLHAKFPQFMPQVDDIDMLLKNEAQAADAEAAVDEITLLEEACAFDVPQGTPELYRHVCRHYFLHGIFEGLRDIGGMKPERDTSGTFAIYRQASYLEDVGEFDEARRLFRLVLHRPHEQYWDGAEYHLGCIAAALGNSAAAQTHFAESLRLNPTHSKALQALNKPKRYREVESNVFESVDLSGAPKVLVILFGDLVHVVNAVPAVVGLQKKFGGKTAWITSPEYAGLIRATLTGKVYEAKSSGTIPWDWIHAEGFTHVFFPEPGANREEWEQSGLHAMDFIAKKCGVAAEPTRPRLHLSHGTESDADAFLRQNRLTRDAFITASPGSAEGRHWPNSNLMKLAQQLDLPVLVLGQDRQTEIPDTIAGPGRPTELVAALISCSSFYIGPAYGMSWIATLTGTPMAVFFDPKNHNLRSDGFAAALRGNEETIRTWDIYTNVETVLDHIESKIFIEAG
jgi:TolA-binding protein